MKKKFYIFAALLAIAAVSCQKEQLKPEKEPVEETPGTEIGEVPEGSVVFTASIAPGKTRTVIGEAEGGDYQPLWTDSDRIIVNNVLSTKTVVLNGGLSARFTVPGVSAPYLVLGPGAKFSTLEYSEEKGTYRVLVNGAQAPHPYSTYTKDETVYPTYPSAASIVAAYSESLDEEVNLTFRHLCVYYKITVDAANSKDADNIRYIYIRQGEDLDGKSDYVAGNWTATYSGSGISFAPTGSLSSAVTLDCGDEGVAHGTTMIVPVPAYDYPNGLMITLKDVKGHFASYVIKPSKTQFVTNAAAGTIYDFTPVFSPGPGTINNAADWELFAAAMNSTKDFDLYRWIGNGTVKIGADIEAETLSKVKGKMAKLDCYKAENASGYVVYNVDGQGHTITLTAGDGALFRNVRGKVENLNVAGTVTTTGTTCGAIADTLYAGGSIEYCNNRASIKIDAATYGIAGGIAAVMTGGKISHCANRGNIEVDVDCTETKTNLQAAGIVGQINNTVSLSGDATLEYCSNSGSILADPTYTLESNTQGINYAAAAGIAGWLRGTAHAFVLDSLTNRGNVTYSAAHIVSTAGTKALPVNVGGIVGIAGDAGNYRAVSGRSGDTYTTATYLGCYDPTVSHGLDVTLTKCLNSGVLYNCGINYSLQGSANNKVYTGGIAGSLVGTSSKHASMTTCDNVGEIYTYDLTGDGSSVRPGYCQVVGGLIGYGSYVDIDDCLVRSVIGNGKRQSASVAGAIGFAERAFEMTDSKIWVTGKLTRISDYNLQTAAVAVVPKQYGSSTFIDYWMVPDLSGSKITGSAVKVTLNYCNAAPSNTADQSDNCTSTLNLTHASNYIVRGRGYSTTTDFTLDENSTLAAAPYRE